jgi:UDP-N-acetylglucosamine--N-acetylmuramyl-(pentapeptide) pyrophosphoryl-undecaprenol N-acetylglucosamine transferase
VRTVFFAGGGTGGHLMPALALADAMVELDRSVSPFFIGSRRGIEASVLPQRPWPFALLPLEPIRRRQWWRNAGLPLALARSVGEVRRLAARHRPALVVGTGGYVAGPAVWEVMRGGVPAVLQEQNAYPGLATRWLAARVRQIHLGFPEARALLRPGTGTEILDSGNPIQPPPAVRPDRRSAKAGWGFDADRPVVLVVGGSQGASAVNGIVDDSLTGGMWPRGVQLLWQVGGANHARFAARDDGGNVRVQAFIDPIGDAYAAADLVVARAGAMTLAELCAWGLPAVLIPLPTSGAGHQLANAAALARAGAAVLLEQSAAGPDALGATLAALLGDPAGLAEYSRNAAARARPEAARRIAAKALELIVSSA